MYFWNINKLKTDITNGNLTEKHRFMYMFIYIFLNAVVIEASSLFSHYVTVEVGSPEYIYSACTLALMIVGMYLCYQANGANKGNDFLGKFFSISFVVAIRLLVALCVFCIVVMGGLSLIDSDSFQTMLVTYDYVFDVGVPLIFTVVFYARIIKHLKDVR